MRNLTDDEFKSVFKHTIERRGWPVLKYGKGKALKRCLKVEGAGDDAHLSWGSKKEGSATKQVKVAEIHDVVNAAFDDAPPNMDPACMLCFNISNRAGLCGNQPLVWVVLTKLENSLARSNRSRFG